MTDDERKLYVQSLMEVHKQNQEVSKTVLNQLMPLIAALSTVALAIFISSGSAIPNINAVNEPYVFTFLIAFQNFMLWDSQWRSGYQKFIEEKLNDALGSDVFKWEYLNDQSERQFSIAHVGFNSVIFIMWVMSFFAGVPSIPHGFGRSLHIVGYTFSVFIVLRGYYLVFNARKLGYKFSNQDPNEVTKAISDRAFQLWEKEGRPFGKEAKHWKRATSQLKWERNIVFQLIARVKARIMNRKSGGA